MDRTRILNLLDTMETRIERLEKAFAPIASKGSNALLQSLLDLKTKVRRGRSRIDVLKSVDIADLRASVDGIQGLSSSPDMEFRLIHPGYQNRLANEAINDEATYLKNLLSGMIIGLNLSGDEIRDLLPGQKPAAFRFAYDDDSGKIVLVDEPFRPAAKQAELAVAALEEIISQGMEVNEDLQQTNAAPRLKTAFSRLQERLAKHRNIVQVGQANGYASNLLASYVDELSKSQFQQLRAHVAGVANVLRQYPEWRIFCENADDIDFDDAAVAELKANASVIAERLRENASADEEVPKALDEVVDWVGDGTRPDKRDVFSLSRTLENLWSFLTQNALAKAVKDEGAKIIARGIIYATLTAVGFGFASALGKLPGAEWMEPTAAYLQAHFQSFAPKP